MRLVLIWDSTLANKHKRRVSAGYKPLETTGVTPVDAECTAHNGKRLCEQGASKCRSLVLVQLTAVLLYRCKKYQHAMYIKFPIETSNDIVWHEHDHLPVFGRPEDLIGRYAVSSSRRVPHAIGRQALAVSI